MNDSVRRRPAKIFYYSTQAYAIGNQLITWTAGNRIHIIADKRDKSSVDGLSIERLIIIGRDIASSISYAFYWPGFCYISRYLEIVGTAIRIR